MTVKGRALIAGVLVFGVGGCSSTSPAPPSTTPPTPVLIVMPNVVGRYWVDAEPALRSAGWTGVLVKGPDITAGPEHYNRIVTQSPAAGGRLAPDDMITVQFGS